MNAKTIIKEYENTRRYTEPGFKLKDFQKDAVRSFFAKKATLIIAPTGSGKTCCYKAFSEYTDYMKNGVILYVSPLNALTREQIDDEDVFSPDMLMNPKSGMSGKMIGISPEKLYIYGRDILYSLQEHKIELKMLVLDEAHMIFEWGEGFRPEYMRIGQFIEQADCKVMLLTATLNDFTRKTIFRVLFGDMDEDQIGIIKADDDENVSVKKLKELDSKGLIQIKTAENSFDNVINELKACDDDHKKMIKLVFCNSVKKANEYYYEFREKPRDKSDRFNKEIEQYIFGEYEGAKPTEFYGLKGESEEDEKAEHFRFLNKKYREVAADINGYKSKSKYSGSIQKFTGQDDEYYRKYVAAILDENKNEATDEGITVFATSALSMGVSNSKIRTVVHADMPEMISMYIQEIGRVRIREDRPEPCLILLFYRRNVIRNLDRILNAAKSEAALNGKNLFSVVRKRIQVYEFLKMFQACEKISKGDSLKSFEYTGNILDVGQSDIEKLCGELELGDERIEQIKNDKLFAGQISESEYLKDAEKVSQSTVDKLYFNTSTGLLDLRLRGSYSFPYNLSDRLSGKVTVTLRSDNEKIRQFDYLVADAYSSLRRNNSLKLTSDPDDIDTVRRIRNLLSGDNYRKERPRGVRRTRGDNPEDNTEDRMIREIRKSLTRLNHTKIRISVRITGGEESREEYDFFDRDNEFDINLYKPSVFAKYNDESAPKLFEFTAIDCQNIKDILDNASGRYHYHWNNIVLTNQILYYRAIGKKQGKYRKRYKVAYSNLYDGYDQLDSRQKKAIRDRAEEISLQIYKQMDFIKGLTEYKDICNKNKKVKIIRNDEDPGVFRQTLTKVLYTYCRGLEDD